MLIIDRKVLRNATSTMCFGTDVTETCVLQDVFKIKTSGEVVSGGYASATYRRNPYKVDGKQTFNATEVKEAVREYGSAVVNVTRYVGTLSDPYIKV